MRIKKVKLKTFGKLKELEFDLSKNFNLIYGLNESGKTTLHEFLLAALYGIGKQETERWRPWTGNEFGGSIVYELLNGEEFEIQREFGRDRIIVYDRDGKDIAKGFPSQKNIGYNVLRTQLGVGKEVFKSSCFVSQAQVDSLGDVENLKSHLQALRDTSTDKQTAKLAKERLDDTLREVGKEAKRGKKTYLAQRFQEVSLLETEKNEKEKIMEEISEKESQMKEKIKIFTELKEKLDEVEYCVSKSEYATLKGKIEKIKKIDAEINQKSTLLEKDKKYQVFPKEHKSEIDTLQGQLKTIKNETEKRKSERKTFGLQLENLQKELQKLPKFQILSEKEQKEFAELETLLRDRKVSFGQERLRLDEMEKRSTEWKKELDGYTQRLGSFPDDIVSKIVEMDKESIELDNRMLTEKQSLENILSKERQINKNFQSLLIALITGVLGIIIGLVLKLFLLTLSGVIISGIFILYLFLTKRSLAALLKQKGGKDKVISEIEISLQKVRTEVQKILQVSKSPDVKNFIKDYEKYRSLKNRREELLIEKQKQITENLEAELRQCKLKIQNLLLKVGMTDGKTEIDDEKIQNFKKGYENFSRLCQQGSSIEQNLKKLDEELLLKEKEEKGLKEKIQEIFKKAKVSNLEEFEESLKYHEQYTKLSQEIEKLKVVKNGILSGKNFEEITIDLDRLEKELTVEENRLPRLTTIPVSPGKLPDYKNECKQISKNIHELDIQIEKIKTQIEQMSKFEKSLDEIKEELRERKKRFSELEIFRDALEKAREIIEEAEKHFHDQYFAPEVDSKAGEIIYQITKRYKEIRIDSSLNIRIRVPEYDEFKEISNFSRGTIDQIYLIIRTIIARLLTGNQETLPIILDEAFTNCDVVRWEETMNFILNLSNVTQIIFFTCHDYQLKKTRELLSKKRGKSYKESKIGEFVLLSTE